MDSPLIECSHFQYGTLMPIGKGSPYHSLGVAYLEQNLLQRLSNWIAENLPMVKYFVFSGSFVFVTIFGNYPSWQFEARKDKLNAYFSDGNGVLGYLVDIDTESHFYLKLSYSDGFKFENGVWERPDFDELVDKYKNVVLNKVCDSVEFTDRLHYGQKIVVDLKDVDRDTAAAIMFNMVIEYEECHSAQLPNQQ